MKFPVKGISIVCLFILFGCASPLKTETDGKALAEILNVPHEEIHFISYCTFDEIRKWEDDIELTQGIVALLESELRIFGARNLRAASPKKEIRIPIQEMDGVGLARFLQGRRIQIKHDEHLIVLEITKDNVFIDKEGSYRLYEMLKERGVPDFETSKFYLH
jgi:hypothetical protein